MQKHPTNTQLVFRIRVHPYINDSSRCFMQAYLLKFESICADLRQSSGQCCLVSTCVISPPNPPPFPLPPNTPLLWPSVHLQKLLSSSLHCPYPALPSSPCQPSMSGPCWWSHADVAGVVLRDAAVIKSHKAFYTRSISDPGLIPLLIASGVTFGAIQVNLYPQCSDCTPPSSLYSVMIFVVG